MAGLLGNSRTRVLAAIYSLNHASSDEIQTLIQQLNKLEIKNPIKIDSTHLTQNDALVLLKATPHPPFSHAIVKIASSPTEITEGREAGFWVIAWTDPHSNTQPQDNEAHFVIKSLSEITKIIETINTFLRMGITPQIFSSPSLINSQL